MAKPAHSLWFEANTYPISRVSTDQGNQGNQGKNSIIFPCREKSGNLILGSQNQGKIREFISGQPKSGKNQGNFSFWKKISVKC